MTKVTLGPRPLLYPMPTLLVGANVHDKPNFMAVAWGGIVCSDPPMISIGIRPRRYTFLGIRQNLAFSVNIPSTDMIKETDYCGIASGRNVDKVEACGFKVFYGTLKTAPLIEQCPVNLECSVVQILALGSHVLVVGRIDEVHVTESSLTDGEPDVEKIKPFIFGSGTGKRYRSVGEVSGEAVSIGQKPKAEE